jgi:hypothetical protein
MSRQYSIDDIAKYKAGSGYGDWIANLTAIGTKEGSGLENNILSNNKMPKKKFGNTDTQLFEGMLGGSMDEMGLGEMEGDGLNEWMSNLSKLIKLLKIRAKMVGSGMDMDSVPEGLDMDMQGEGITDWFKNLYNVIRKPSEALKSMPKPIADFNDKYGTYDIISMEVCREPLSAGLQNIIDRASGGNLMKTLSSSPYDALYHLYANVYLKHSTTGQTKACRVEKNQRVEIFDKIVPPKGGAKGKCMSVPNIKPNTAWLDFWKNTDETTWNYNAVKYNCQNFLKRRLEELDLLTPELKDFIMQDIDTLLPGAEVQKSIAKGITDAASILQNIWKGGAMCNCGDKCGCGLAGGYLEQHVHLKDGKYPDITGDNTQPWRSDYAGRGKKKKKRQKGGWVDPHIHQVWPREGVGWTGEVVGQWYDPDFGKH